jgi:two-component system, NtrC family, sensor kinase
MVQNALEEHNYVLAMIVDDDPADRNLLSYCLSHEGYKIEPVTDSREVIDRARELNPDIILLDVYMPEITGIDVCHRLKTLEATRHVPIIMLTGMADRDTKLECLEAGANDFISKPINMTELLIKVRNLVQLKEFENIKIKSQLMADTFATVEKIKREWEESMDCIKDIVILADAKSRVIRCNKTLCLLTNRTYDEIMAQDWREVLLDGGFSNNPDFEASAEICHDSGRWFILAKYKIESEREPNSLGAVITLNDITESKKITNELIESRELLRVKNDELDSAIRDLKTTQSQMLQQEKMASIGQIAAGVAHEINNPMGYIISNFNALQKYTDRISEFLALQSDGLNSCAGNSAHPEILGEICEARERLRIDQIIPDINNLIEESLEGANRVRMIVKDLKNFSRLDEPEHKFADINAGIESTLNIIWNEIKYKITLVKDLGEIPQTKCNLGQLNQVFMNMLVNAAQSIDKQGEIRIKTWQDDGRIYISISDTGCGIPEDLRERIFEPFVTTKEIGKGTGLGLSIAYDIIRKHGGNVSVESEVGKGSTFTVDIPVSNGKDR